MGRALMVVAVCVAACGGSAAPATPSSTPWHIVTVQRSAAPGDIKAVPLLHIAVPPTWTVATNDSAWFKRVAQFYGEDGRTTLLVLAEAKDLLADPTVTVMTWHLDDDYSVEDIAAATFGNYFDSSRALMVEARSMELGTQHARRQELRWETTTTGTHGTMWAVQYFVRRARDTYMLEFLAAFDDRASLVDLFDSIAATLVLP